MRPRFSITAKYWYMWNTDSCSMWYPLFTGMCVCMFVSDWTLLATPIYLQSWKFKHRFLLMVPKNGFFVFLFFLFFDIFFWKNVPFRSFQHNFVSSTLRNMVLVSYTHVFGYKWSNGGMPFWKVPDEQGCQIWTLGLPDLNIRVAKLAFLTFLSHFWHFQHNFG